MELGSWSLITAPSLLALIPLIVMIVLVFRGKSNVSGMMVGIILGALMMGQDLGALAKAFSASLGSTTALIGVIIMTGAGLGVLMTETGVTHTLVYWIVKRIGVNTPTKGKLALVVWLHPDLRPAGYFRRRKCSHCPHYASNFGVFGCYPYRGGHALQGGR